MNILITGGTGFVGRAAVLRLLRDEHSITVLTRSPRKAKIILGGAVDLLDASISDSDLSLKLNHIDAVVHLAGESVAQRWSPSAIQKIENSRIQLSQRLLRAAENCESAPKCWISASAVGFYGSSAKVNDESSAGDKEDLLGDLCNRWEKITKSYPGRNVVMRIGVVLGRGGGILAKLKPIFTKNLGGTIGDGKQWMSWIHLHDLVEFIAKSVADDSFNGTYNLVAEEPITNKGFTRKLSSQLNRKAILPVPKTAIKLAFGKGAFVVLSDQRVISKRLSENGFTLQFPKIEDALQDLCGNHGIEIDKSTGQNKASYVLKHDVGLNAAVEDVFPFFAEAGNLSLITPPTMSLVIQNKMPIEMKKGQKITYQLALGPIGLKWRTLISDWNPNKSFEDTQEKGPYKVWIHRHSFSAESSDKTRMKDEVFYRPPLGILGTIANSLFIRSQLEDIFAYRADAMRLRFGLRK